MTRLHIVSVFLLVFLIVILVLDIAPKIVFGKVAIIVILLLLFLFVILDFPENAPVGDDVLLVGIFAFLLLASQVVVLVIALDPLLVLHIAAFIEASAEASPLLLHAELGPIADVTGRPASPVDIATFAALPVIG